MYCLANGEIVLTNKGRKIGAGNPHNGIAQ